MSLFDVLRYPVIKGSARKDFNNLPEEIKEMYRARFHAQCMEAGKTPSLDEEIEDIRKMLLELP